MQSTVHPTHDIRHQENGASDNMKKIGIIICNRYHTCAGGKCLRALRNREGAFARYKDEEVELVGYTTCGGCPGGNVEYAPAEMKRSEYDGHKFYTRKLKGISEHGQAK
jgi:hypothetical protein